MRQIDWRHGAGRWLLVGCVLALVVAGVWWIQHHDRRTWKVHGAGTALALTDDEQAVLIAERRASPDITTVVQRRALRDGQVLQTFAAVPDNLFTLVLGPRDDVVVAGGTNTLWVWRIEDGALLQQIDVPLNGRDPDYVTQIVVTPDGAALLAVTNAGIIHRWRLSDGARRELVSGAPEILTERADALSQDGSLAARREAQQIRVWKLADATTTTVIANGTASPLSNNQVGLVFSPDQKHIAAVVGSEITVWRLSDGARTAVLRGHWDMIYAMAWSADSQRILSSSGVRSTFAQIGDRTTRLWDANTGAALNRWRGPAARSLALVMSASGRSAVMSSADGTITVFALR